ncbi:MAG: hypothetical protein NTV07_00070 [Candidatus Omnitrophica bacterium]|nr:hypothetical protein [Candidatus Omnitrophota bacterium]
MQIFGPGHNYGKGPERRIVVIHGIQDGGNSNMIEDQLQQAIKEVLALQQV